MRRVRASDAAVPSWGQLGVAVPERLVGLGFRYWLTGFRTGDISCWERAWCAYSSTLGASLAKTAVTDLSCWVRAINRHARRDLVTARRRLRSILPRRVHCHRDDLRLPAQCLPGHARLRVRAARLLDDRRGRRGRRDLRCDDARRRPGVAADLRSWFFAAGGAACQRIEAVSPWKVRSHDRLLLPGHHGPGHRRGSGRDPEPAQRAPADARGGLPPSQQEDGVLRMLAAGRQHDLREDRSAGREGRGVPVRLRLRAGPPPQVRQRHAGRAADRVGAPRPAPPQAASPAAATRVLEPV